MWRTISLITTDLRSTIFSFITWSGPQPMKTRTHASSLSSHDGALVLPLIVVVIANNDFSTAATAMTTATPVPTAASAAGVVVLSLDTLVVAARSVFRRGTFLASAAAFVAPSGSGLARDFFIVIPICVTVTIIFDLVTSTAPCLSSR